MRAEQQIAVDAVAAHELGVLVAPPDAGKTVMGCAAIARHQAPALILADRTPLVDQWKERLCEHLGLGPRETVEDSTAKISDDRYPCVWAGFAEKLMETVTYTRGADLTDEFQCRRPCGFGRLQFPRG